MILTSKILRNKNIILRLRPTNVIKILRLCSRRQRYDVFEYLLLVRCVSEGDIKSLYTHSVTPSHAQNMVIVAAAQIAANSTSFWCIYRSAERATCRRWYADIFSVTR